MTNIINLPISPLASVLVKVGDRFSPKTTIVKYDKNHGVETIHLAKFLNVAEGKIAKYIKKTGGEEVAAGEVLAEKKGIFSKSLVRSPLTGKVVAIDYTKGIISLLKYDKEKKEDLVSVVSGKVVAVSKSGVEIEIDSPLFKAEKGEGKEVVGDLSYLAKDMVSILDVHDEVKDRVILCQSAHAATLVKFQVLGVKGVVMLKIKGRVDLPWLEVDEKIFEKLITFDGCGVWVRPKQKEIVCL